MTATTGRAEELAIIPANVYPGTTSRTAEGVVTIGGVGVDELAQRHGTPLFVYDEADFRARCTAMAQAFGRYGKVHYASKAFLSVEVARWVEQEGLSLDVCTGGELAIALHAGFPPARIAMHGNNKSADELAAAVTAGVGHVVLDSLVEIERLNAVAEQHGRVVDVLVRVTPGVNAHTHEFISTAHEDQKFGFSISGGKAIEAVRAVFATQHLRLVGLHSHIGSQIFDLDGFEIAAHRVIGLLGDVVAEFGRRAEQLSIIDLGGGLGISYVPGDDPLPVSALADALADIVARESAALGLPVPTLAVEPGRAIAGPPGITLYRVGTIKDVELDGGGVRRYVSVDGGMSDNIRGALYDAEYDVRLASRVSTVDGVLSRVVGKHCETGDIVIRDCWLPGDLKTGDLLIVGATGAYCYSMSSRYNMVMRPAVVAVRDGQSREILRRETVADLLSLEVTQ
ncbi:MAG TPA: diaminopimelate decarboxylase [Gordonia sp. (in: high G+C Gram-positive bacteria)]|uniref:diaminopimelate decarboxylase n=1 Tax=unclassified Gordonia (in: high G+C Gram-positive bacteria) TaxID=2657482 RepID=UPI0025B7E577|nr:MULTISPECIES: diaminopimelate decarboxylase [unclassified Gordonia (in: high G+C Gram-positive bacteria)]HNP57468.1 diaminopimelate decarboxylase [Gordonia sp. (in: high G+C Gram-positive bacteria)]HRC51209.1 diaminopimelate decarboxylase [Gordonia sp. (in: high G+C Gram-positive bacteria)]